MNTFPFSAGTALVEQQSPPHSHGGLIPTSQPLKSNNRRKTDPAKTSNRMPGNIVCGICGAVRYYAFILQAKKFGTFSCEPCRKFISKTIRRVKEGTSGEAFTCISDTGKCVVPPVIRGAVSALGRKKSDGDVRCQACWLKLCLIGYNLENDLYDRLRLELPKLIQGQLPMANQRSPSKSLVPHRGEILEFNRKVPLSRPLFDGFGEGEGEEGEGCVAKVGVAAVGGGKPHVVHERLPNGWTKKAVKRMEGKFSSCNCEGCTSLYYPFPFTHGKEFSVSFTCYYEKLFLLTVIYKTKFVSLDQKNIF